MRSGMIAFMVGLLVLRFLPTLPPGELLVAIALLSAALLLTRAYPVGSFLLGLCWACTAAQYALDDRLVETFDGRTLWIEGRVSGLPEKRQDSTRFLVEKATSRRGELPSLIRVSWRHAPEVKAGERWRLAVELKKPYGVVNFQGSDTEAWLLAHRIGATGSVKAGQRIAGQQSLDAWRDRLRHRLLEVDAYGRNGGLSALILGDGSGLSTRDWQLLRDTGTTHLMVISGQHITLLAGFIFAGVALLARLGCWPSRLPWLPLACVLSLSVALSYGVLAGFDVPVRRACVMIGLVMLWRLRFRHLNIWTPVSIALAVVLAFDPLVSLLPGFWLSFAAVGMLIWIFGGRLGTWSPWRTWGRAQWMMAVGLAPLLMALGLPISITGPLANLIAVPWVDLLVVPAALGGALLLLVLPSLGMLCLSLAGGALHLLFIVLHWIAEIAPAWQPTQAPVWALVMGMLGLLVLLAPEGFPLRGLGLFLAAPLCWPPLYLPAPGVATIRVLDIGQGLSVLVQTRDHVLLYDAGPKSGDFDTGEWVVVPALKSMGIGRLDMMILSHGDADHAGGALAVAQGMTVGRVLSGEPLRIPPVLGPQSCHDMRWLWNGVMFTTWQPAPDAKGNAASCLLLVEASGERLFLTGDIDQQTERRIIASGRDIHADWLVIPHHGSRSSSSAAFIAAVAPSAALLSRGRYNSFGHPHPSTLARYEAAGVRVYDTAMSGALTFTLGKRDLPQGARQKRYFWREN
ncbi:competence protein ComEC [Pseudomonas duriflava]|uniref:Competence protein ComEC n=1 Tax=Pseudomonas duriflava TaxID=459528 RepID=A0A562QBK1_9PSED|nr:DNA internalization-related competence protein ComEC/Rec2 [Pseudomonas duriflava]TWI53406.1 competence protein ComEC [Pseudomonas duriflava]